MMDDATKDSDKDPMNLLQQIRAAVAAAAKLASRRANTITLIAVSKTRSIDEIRPLLAAGHRIFGENRVQEAAEKWPILRDQYAGIELHLIGQLQSKKADDAVALFDVIHSVDRLSVIQALGKAMQKTDRFIPCFLQVNIGDEDQKGGCAITDIPALLAAAHTHKVPIIGLMCLPPADVEPAPYFALLAELAGRNHLDALSMGMSSDFATAIMLGASHIRIGTALFGARS